MAQRDSKATLTFEMLDTWQKTRMLVQNIYILTRHPGVKHDYGLTNQIRRAGVSIMCNTAEGHERTHLGEKLQFYNIARGSTAEVRSLLYVIEDNYPELYPQIEESRGELGAAGRLLSGLIRSTERRRRIKLLACTLPFLIALLL